MQWEGLVLKKTVKEAVGFLNELAEDDNQWVADKIETKKIEWVHPVDAYTTL